MNNAHIIRIGNFAAIELTTGTKSRAYPKRRALRILKGVTR